MFTSIEENERRLEYKERKVILNRLDPYGLWSVSMEEGNTPDALRGMYVTPKDAVNDIYRYIDQVSEIQERREKKRELEAQRPKIKYKKVKEQDAT
jgi:hypothetical protein